MFVTVHEHGKPSVRVAYVGDDAIDQARAWIARQDISDRGYVYRTSQGQRIVGIQCRDLAPGDLLLPSGTTVLTRPTTGARTPGGKVELSVVSRGGTQRLATWGRYTKVSIIRHTGA